MKKQIRELFPEIAQIKNEKLKQQVISTWEEAIKEGGWQLEDLESIPFTLLIPDCPVDLIAHTKGVIQTAIKVAGVLLDSYKDRVKIDFDVLIAGAILHDVGKITEYVREGKKVVKSRSGKLLRHPFSGAALAYKHGLPQEVIHMIATHAKEGDGGYRTTEAMIVHYADFINFESLGGKV
jgi:putative nucleotidyltransferase with HDIG domain